MKTWRRAALLVLGALVAGDAVRIALWKPFGVEGAAPADGWTRVSGVVHVHTTASDGGGTPEQVVAAAQAAGLGFLAITDHNTFGAKPVEGWHGSTLVLVGTEASTVAGHVVALGLDDPGYVFSRDPTDTMDDVRALGGAAFVAHPTSPRADLRWDAWDTPGAWGLEVLNGDSQFREAGWPRRVHAAFAYPLNAPYALLSHMSRPAAALERWDGILATRPVAAIAGADAHGQIEISRTRALKLPSYAASFAVARTHVLLERPFTRSAGPDGQDLVAALAAGRSYVGVDGLADAGGFFFEATGPGHSWTMGESAPPAPLPRLRAGGRMPRGTRLVLLRDGRPLAEAVGGLDVAAPGPGLYRVEAYVPGWGVPWVITNPIAVLDASAAAARARRAAWPTPAPAPAPAAVLETFDSDTHFFDVGRDERSSVEQPLWDARGGTSGGAARFAFRLGVPGPGYPHTFCALLNRAPRDLSGRHGLVFAVRADGVYRFWVQVRDANPASPDEGTEWWFSSVRTSRDWQRVALPFARLRSIQKNSDGKLDPDKVKALVFIVDKGAMPPGSKGTIWIDDLGVY